MLDRDRNSVFGGRACRCWLKQVWYGAKKAAQGGKKFCFVLPQFHVLRFKVKVSKGMCGKKACGSALRAERVLLVPTHGHNTGNGKSVF